MTTEHVDTTDTQPESAVEWNDLFAALRDSFRLKQHAMDKKVLSVTGSASERQAIKAVVELFAEVFAAMANPGQFIAGHRAFIARIQEEQAAANAAEQKPLVTL